MADLYFCYIEVFGSNFDADRFSHDMALPSATIIKRDKAYHRSPVRALREGNVHYWKTQKKYYVKKENTDQFCKHIEEEKFMVNFIKEFRSLNDVLLKYKNNTTETWFIAVYKAQPSEKPAGVHFGVSLIKELNKIEAAISTEIVF